MNQADNVQLAVIAAGNMNTTLTTFCVMRGVSAAFYNAPNNAWNLRLNNPVAGQELIVITQSFTSGIIFVNNNLPTDIELSSRTLAGAPVDGAPFTWTILRMYD